MKTFTRSQSIVLLFFISSLFAYSQDSLRDFSKGSLLYKNSFRSERQVRDWIMEGPGVIEFKRGWMHMYSPDEEWHHVFWGPETFPSSFMAEWEAQRLHTELGLCIVFFAAKGKNGEDIFNPSFPARNGDFPMYTRSDYFNCYHISYYANPSDAPDRGITHLRKNSGFHLVQHGEIGIPVNSEDIHKVTLIKDGPRIVMFIDERKIIDWTDDGEEYGPALEEGRIGLRQMRWTHFRYRNFKVWELK